MGEFFKQNFQMFAMILAAIAICAGLVWAVVYYLYYAVRSQVLGKTIWRGNGDEENSVALTFDDGPSPDTLKILDVLRDENVKATFFLIGKQVEKYPEIARRIVAEGHEIGNHSYSHPIFLFSTTNKTRREIIETQRVIKNVIGAAPKLVRPPCGVRSKAYFAVTEELGLQTIQWSEAGFDWEKISAEKIAQNILKNVQKNSIILLHDGDSAEKSDRLATVEAIPLILKGLKTKGLLVATLSEMLEIQSPRQNYLLEKTT